MNLKFYDLPKLETIKRHTVSIQASISTTSKVKLKNLDAGLTTNGAPRKLPFRNRKAKNSVAAL